VVLVVSGEWRVVSGGEWWCSWLVVHRHGSGGWTLDCGYEEEEEEEEEGGGGTCIDSALRAS
jgi:hypothetical protein